MDLLRQKLQSKIAQKQALRGLSPHSSSSSPTKSAATATSKRAARRKRKEDLKNHHQRKKEKGGFSGAEGDKSGKVVAVSPLGNGKETKAAQPTVTDDLNSIDFGSMTGLVKKKSYGNNKSLNNLGKKKSLDRLLQEAEAKKSRLKELKSSDKVEVRASKANESSATIKLQTLGTHSMLEITYYCTSLNFSLFCFNSICLATQLSCTNIG